MDDRQTGWLSTRDVVTCLLVVMVAMVSCSLVYIILLYTLNACIGPAGFDLSTIALVPTLVQLCRASAILLITGLMG